MEDVSRRTDHNRENLANKDLISILIHSFYYMICASRHILHTVLGRSNMLVNDNDQRIVD